MARFAPFVLAFALVATFACHAADQPPGIDPRVVKLFGGAESVAALQKSDKVEAWRIDGQELFAKPGEEKVAPNLHRYPILSGPVAVEAAAATKLAGVLLKPDSYEWEVAKGCEFMPGVVVRFTRGKTTVDVLICFSCNEIAVYSGDKRVGGEDIDSIRGTLAAIVKKLFPDDAEIQKLGG